MSFHLVGPWLSTTNSRKRKSKLTKKQQAELEAYKKERDKKEQKSFTPAKINSAMVNKFPNLNVPAERSTRHIKSLNADNFAPCTVSSIMDPKNLAKESPEVREAIIAKSQRIAPAYNKGAAQFITDGYDPTDIGRKK